MKAYLARFIGVAAIALPLVFGAPAPAPTFPLNLRNAAVTDVIANSYIVVYNSGVSAAAIESHVSTFSAALESRKRDFALHTAGIKATYHLNTFKGYHVIADSATLAEIAASPEVDYIEKDGIVTANFLRSRVLTTEGGAPWGLGRVSHKVKGSTDYIYDTSAGDGVTVYVIDTGVYIEHSEFGGRASWGHNFVDGSPDLDEYGHGTHCSGTIAGSTYGVSKSAKIVAVKVLDASGRGTYANVISGIQWVAENAAVPSKAVISMSIGGPKSDAVNAALAAGVATGIVSVVAAGNNGADTKNYSPSSEPSAITVAAIDSTDTRASFSNFGDLIDVFAPGVGVLSSYIGSPTATLLADGTSMATPHVAGLAAYFIALEGANSTLTTPAAVLAKIQALAVSGAVPNPGTGTANNLIAYNGNGA